jgi:hypothetical protein
MARTIASATWETLKGVPLAVGKKKAKPKPCAMQWKLQSSRMQVPTARWRQSNGAAGSPIVLTQGERRSTDCRISGIEELAVDVG